MKLWSHLIYVRYEEDIDSNNIKTEGALYIFNGLRKNKTLNSLNISNIMENLGGNNINGEGEKPILDALRENRSLISLSLGSSL